MEKKRSLSSLVFIGCVLLVICNFSEAEELNLKKVTDSQDNVYQIDSEGKIYTDGIPHPNRQPVTVENLPYYFNQSMMLEVNGYLEEAIKMYYEILSLPKVDRTVMNAREGIALRIKRLYDDNKAKDLILRYFNVKKLSEGDLIQYENKKFHFAFQYPSSWSISKEVVEDKQKSIGFIALVAPALLDNEGKAVDVSIGLLAEDISHLGEIQSKEYADIWYKKISNYTRADSAILNGEKIKNKFTFNFMGNDYCGEEVFWVKNGIGYYMTFNAGPSSVYELTKNNFYQILNTVK